MTGASPGDIPARPPAGAPEDSPAGDPAADPAGAPRAAPDTWRRALVGDLLLFGHYLTPRARLRALVRAPSSKALALAALQVGLVSAFVALAVLGLLDGPEVVAAFLRGNFKAHSLTLLDWSLYTYLLLWGTIAGVAVGAPFLFLWLGNRTLPAPARARARGVALVACYGALPVLFYAPLLYVAAIFRDYATPLLYHLHPHAWYDPLYYGLAALIVAALAGTALLTRRALGWSWRRAAAGPLVIAAGLVVAGVVLFVP